MSVLTFPPADRIALTGEYFFAEANKHIAAVKARGVEVINLGAGSPDLSPPSAVIGLMQSAVADPTMHGYPSYTGLPVLKQAIAAWYQREYSVELDSESMVLPLAGSKEGIVFLTQAVVNPGEVVLIPDLGYSTYARAATLAGARAVEYRLDPQHRYLPDFSAVSAEDLAEATLLWINYPHNPTGAMATEAELADLVAFAREHHLILASDNPYSHVTFTGQPPLSILQVPGALEVAIELDSFSKTYNMAGWRLAWAAGNEQVIRHLATYYSNAESGIFTAVQLAGVTALETPASWITERNQVYLERRTVVKELLELLGCRLFETQASLYVWAELPATVTDAAAYCLELLEKMGIFLTPGTVFGQAGAGHVRASICQPIELLRVAVERIRAAQKKHA